MDDEFGGTYQMIDKLFTISCHENYVDEQRSNTDENNSSLALPTVENIYNFQNNSR